MKELFKGIYEWSWFSEEKQYNFNGHLIVSGDERVLIDPPPMTHEDVGQVHALGPVTAIIVTNVHHIRETEKYRDLFHTKAYVPEKDQDAIEIGGDLSYRHLERLPGGLETVNLSHNKSPGESALYAAKREGGIWILGDALIGAPKGELHLMAANKYKDVRAAKEGMRVLLDRPFDIVLVGDGASLLKGGRAALEHFLASG